MEKPIEFTVYNSNPIKIYQDFRERGLVNGVDYDTQTVLNEFYGTKFIVKPKTKEQKIFLKEYIKNL